MITKPSVYKSLTAICLTAILYLRFIQGNSTTFVASILYHLCFDSSVPFVHCSNLLSFVFIHVRWNASSNLTFIYIFAFHLVSKCTSFTALPLVHFWQTFIQSTSSHLITSIWPRGTIIQKFLTDTKTASLLYNLIIYLHRFTTSTALQITPSLLSSNPSKFFPVKILPYLEANVTNVCTSLHTTLSPYCLHYSTVTVSKSMIS